jgi:Right handed beta helix region
MLVRAVALAVVACGLLAGCGGSGKRAPASFYVDAIRGDDTASGRTPATAWRTLDPVAETQFVGGDRLLLRGGERFPGTIALDPETLESTSEADKLTLDSYGPGRATIEAGRRADAIALTNVSGVRVSGIDLVGRGNRLENCRGKGFRDSSTGAGLAGPAGIRLTARELDGTLDDGITIDHVDVSGFCDGVVVASADDGSRIAHVVVRNVRAHDNGDAGVWTHDQALAQHSIEDVVVTDTRAYRNQRRGGIVLFGVDGGTVTHSVAFDNARGAGGGVGFWAFDADRIVFDHNEAFGNGRATLDNDGDGFDFDRGVSNSVMTNNYSHDNGGIGFLVCSCGFGDFYEMHDITLRDNVSRNDGSSGQPPLFVLGGEPMSDIEIAANRVESGAGSGPLVRVSAGKRGYSDLTFRENTFVAVGGKRLLEVDGPQLATDLVFDRNAWRALGGPFEVQWGERLFSSERAWLAAIPGAG